MPNTKTIIFHHDADHDGNLSAFLFLDYLKSRNTECLVIGCNYGREPYDVLNTVNKDIDVVLLDFCFEQEGVMECLKNNAKSFTWIDHHQKAIDLFKHLDLEGLQSNEKACCQLTWEYLYPVSKTPVAVTLLGLFDSWKHEDRKDVIGFEYYLQSLSLTPEDTRWNHFLSLTEMECRKYADFGWVCYRRETNLAEQILDKNGFTVNLHGYNCLAINTSTKGSLAFGNRIKDFDFCISFLYTGKIWKYGVYSVTADAAEFSHRFYGGGGHKGAAGFQTPDLIFRKAQ